MWDWAVTRACDKWSLRALAFAERCGQPTVDLNFARRSSLNRRWANEAVFIPYRSRDIPTAAAAMTAVASQPRLLSQGLSVN
jgi:hypothetical protein